MSNYTDFFTNLKQNENCGEKGRLLEALLNSFQRGNTLSRTELAEMKQFVFEEINKLTALIPTLANYKAKDEAFYYEDKLVGLFTFLCAKNVAVSDEEINKINVLVKLVAEYQVLETAVNETFKLQTITPEDVKKVIEIAKSIKDEYQKGLLFQGLLHYEKQIGKFTAEAKAETANYIASETERYLKKKEKLTEDEINNLEIVSDICKHFICEKTVPLLQQILTLPHNNIRYYALDTLIACKGAIPDGVIAELAQDLNYANLTYYLLETNRLLHLYPQEYADAEYLAKSDMVHWLTYPTELGKMPDEIEFLGKVKVKREEYYVFKYKSDSDNLSDDLKGEWLVGWSSDEGGTFSHFDKLSEYEKKKPAKTLKAIRKTLKA
ncbi:MAG: hypothetical protein K2K12_00990 [Clostridia bacterium]|nr:hypothetical protein [Clostridia bacterium]